MSVDGCLEAAFGAGVSWEPLGEEVVMAWSGCHIQELRLLAAKDGPAALPERLVLKRATRKAGAMGEGVSQAELLKAQRTDESYASEVAFLAAHGEWLGDRGIGVPRTYYAEAEGEGFALLMQSMSEAEGWVQHTELPQGGVTRGIVRWLASFHAAFLPRALGGGGPPVSSAQGMWEVGTHTILERRPFSEVEDIPDTLGRFAEAFASVHPYFATPGARAMGARLRAAAEGAAAHLRPGPDGAGVDASGRVVSVVHGDCKQANLFFRPLPGGGEGEAEVCAIDWQWTGLGTAVGDVVYLCAMALSDTVVENFEDEVLRPYHAELCAVLERGGGGAGRVDYGALRRDFGVAAMDFLRWLSGARLGAHTPEKMAAMAAKVDIGRAIALRHAPRMAWVWARAEEGLDEWETRGGPPAAAP